MMENEEFIKLVVHRFGVSIGEKLKRKQLIREVKEAKETSLIKEGRLNIKSIEQNLLYQDFDAKTRKELRSQRSELKDQVRGLETQRKIATQGTREEREQLSDILVWIDEAKLVPELEARNMTPEQTVSTKELAEARKYKDELRESQKKKKK